MNCRLSAGSRDTPALCPRVSTTLDTNGLAARISGLPKGSTRPGVVARICQGACKPGSVPHAVFTLVSSRKPAMRRQPFISATDCPVAPAANPDGISVKPACRSPEGSRRAVPIRPCSGWGLPCGCRCRKPGALLPHPFSLACAPRERRAIGGMLSVALSLNREASPRPGGRYPPPLFHGARTFLGPRTKSAADAAAQPPGPSYLAWPRSRSKSNWNNIARPSPSISPSIRSGRQRRWNASTALRPSVMS